MSLDSPLMRRLFCILIALAICVLPDVRNAHGQGVIRAQAPPLRQACVADYMRFCRGVLPGRGRILLCLNAHANELTQTCFQALALRGLASAGALRICREDYDRLCAQAAPGWGRGLACLLDNTPALSPPCRDALTKQGVFDDEPGAPDFRK
ncbi:MAG: cysteine rich repeat-containing protein [Hyphomicrobiaceae bacterium]